MPFPDLESLRTLGRALVHVAAPLAPADWACIAASALIQRLAARLGPWLCALVALPGTLAHELAHYAIATILRAQPTLPSLLPKRTADGWQLGAVAFRAGPLRALPIAMAPVVLAPLALWIALHTMAGHPVGGPYVAWAWACGALVHAGLPSRQDWRVAAPGLGIVAVLAGLAVAGLYALRA